MTVTAPGKGGAMDVGIDSFVSLLPDRATGEPPSPDRRLALLLEEIVVADRAGVAIFGVGEHQRKEFVDAATTVVLAAAAARTTDIRLTSSVTVLGAADPVRVFQDFAALDLISGGRAEITVGRGAFHEAFPLFGLHQHDPDALFSEKLDLLLKLRAGNHIEWSGHYRPRLSGQGVFPRPLQARLPIRLGVGGTPASFVRAGTLGLPLMLAIIGGAIPAYRPLLDLYRDAGARAGHRPEDLRIGIHVKGLVADDDTAARDAFFPGYHHIIATLGAERGWQPPTRRQFDAACDPAGPFFVGAVSSVIDKMSAAYTSLGGLDRITFEASSASGDHPAMLRSAELLGTRVAPHFHEYGFRSDRVASTVLD